MKSLKSISYFIPILFALFILGCEDHNPQMPDYGSTMNVVSTYPTPGNALDSYVKNISGIDYAFIAMGSSGVLVLDVTNPYSVQPVANYVISGYCEETSAAFINNVPHLFVACGGNGTTVLDISNINTPILDTSINFSNDYISSIYVDTVSKILYTGGSYSKMYLTSLSNLPAVTGISTYQSYSNINEIQISGNTAYIAQDGGLDIVNVSNPSAPTRINLGNSNDYAYDVKLTGSLALVSNNQNGVIIFNMSNPSNPQKLGVLETSDIALACTVNGNLVYVAEDQGGVETFDISNPNNPRYLSYYTSRYFSENVFYYNGNVFVSDLNDYVVLRYP